MTIEIILEMLHSNTSWKWGPGQNPQNLAAKKYFFRKGIVLAIRFAQRNYYSDDLSSHGELRKEMYPPISSLVFVGYWGAVGKMVSLL